MKQIFKESFEYTNFVIGCFVDLEKACYRVSQHKLWRVPRLYRQPKFVFVGMLKNQSHFVHLRQSCGLSPNFFLFYINCMGVTSGRKKSRLLFADDLVLNGFEAACDIAGIKTDTFKTDVLRGSGR